MKRNAFLTMLASVPFIGPVLERSLARRQPINVQAAVTHSGSFPSQTNVTIELHPASSTENPIYRLRVSQGSEMEEYILPRNARQLAENVKDALKDSKLVASVHVEKIA